jgi:hypothetical protein
MYNPLTNIWTSLANYAGPPVYTAVSFSIDSLGYIATGYPLSKKVYQYDPISNNWQQMSDFSGSARQSATSFVINDTAYLVTGYISSSPTNELWRYNKVGDTWTQLQSMPSSDRYGAASLSLNGIGIVVTGGSGSTYYSDCFGYNHSINQWINIPAFAGIGRRHAAYFTIGNYGYISCGVSSVGVLNDLWELSEVTGIAKSQEANYFTITFNNYNKELTIQNKGAVEAQLSLYSLNGKRLMLNALPAQDHSSLSLTDYASGLYLCVISVGDRTVSTQRILVP